MEAVIPLIAGVVVLAIACLVLVQEALFWKRLAEDRHRALEALKAEWATAKILMPSDVRRQVDTVINSWCSKPDITGGTP